MQTVVQGPKTRLGHAFLNLQKDKHGVALIARNPQEARLLGEQYPDAQILERGKSQLKTSEPLALFLFALGPLHTEGKPLENDLEEFQKDLSFLQECLSRSGWRGRILFISSILAHFPRAHRTYYGGWKLLIEGVLKSWTETHPGIELCVLYPGRLVTGRSSHPKTWFSTPYPRAARKAASLLTRRKPGRAIVGTDGRMWMILRSFAALNMVLSRTTR